MLGKFVSGGKKGGLIKILMIGILASVVLALNIPGRLGLGGGLASVAILAVGGLFLRRMVPSLGTAMIIAGGTVLAATFVTPRLMAFTSPTNSNAPAALTLSQMSDPIVRRFR